MKPAAPQTPPRRVPVWRAPVAIGVVTTIGLIAALVTDGSGDVISWFALGLPVAVIVRYVGWPSRRD